MREVGEALGDRPTASTMLCSGFKLVNWVMERTSGCELCRRLPNTETQCDDLRRGRTRNFEGQANLALQQRTFSTNICAIFRLSFWFRKNRDIDFGARVIRRVFANATRRRSSN
jgi:hypothetical protein